MPRIRPIGKAAADMAAAARRGAGDKKRKRKARARANGAGNGAFNAKDFVERTMSPYLSFGHYEMREGEGLFHVTPRLKKEPLEEWICRPFKILARVRSSTSDNWASLVEWDDEDKTPPPAHSPRCRVARRHQRALCHVRARRAQNHYGDEAQAPPRRLPERRPQQSAEKITSPTNRLA